MGLAGWSRACALSLALAACGDNHETTTASGARLRLQWLAYADGTRQLVNGELWDEGRDETCLPQRWSDGNTYCTPNQRAGLYAYYMDAGCTQVEYLAEAPEQPRYVARFADGRDDAAMSSLARPEPTTLSTYWTLTDGACTGPYAGNGRTVYRAGADVPRSDLVRLRASETTGNGRVAVRATTSDDGLYLPNDFVDRRLHSPCVLDARATASATCLPVATANVAYRDPDCSGAVLVAADDQDKDDLPPAILAGETCDPRVYAVGAESAEAPGYARERDTCVEATEPGGRWFELVEHPVAIVSRAREPSTGRRLERILMNIDGVQVAASQLFDTSVGEECVRATSPREPDVYYCVPRDVGWIGDAFLDAACTIPFEVALVYAGRSRDVCDTPAAPRYAREFTGATLIRYLGARRTEPVYNRIDGTCRPDTSPYYDFYELGVAIPDEQWARGTIVRD